MTFHGLKPQSALNGFDESVFLWCFKRISGSGGSPTPGAACGLTGASPWLKWSVCGLTLRCCLAGWNNWDRRGDYNCGGRRWDRDGVFTQCSITLILIGY